MKLLLVRHGETVDNVAGVYAGVRDSALTNHGILQAERLGRHLVDREIRATHLHTSKLSRAVKTGAIILRAQQEGDCVDGKCQIQQFAELQEQNFGYYEGKPFYARQQQASPKKGNAPIGREQHRQQHVHEAGFQDVESKAALDVRARAYLTKALIPIVQDPSRGTSCVIVVSHGILLSHLWRSLILLFHRKDIVLAGTAAIDTSTVVLEHLGGWSNTGFLEIDIVQLAGSASPSIKETQVRDQLRGYGMTIRTINGKNHLEGLKRTRGIGSSRHDDGQRKMDTFFKRRKSD